MDESGRILPSLFVLVAILALTMFFVTACDSGEREETRPDVTGEQVTLATNAETSNEETTSSIEQYIDEATGEEATTSEPDAVLRMEGERGTRFTGVCGSGEERDVLSGEVPGRFEFTLDEEDLSCVIQKRTTSGGSLRVVLTSEGRTRSVQQIGVAGGEVRVSFSAAST